jgi:hypothetical protein
MHKEIIVLLLSFLAVLGLFIGVIQIASSEPVIGVKNGDWIEYHVSTSGTPPSEKNIVWARTEILDVQGNEFKTNTTGQSPNGTYSSFIRTFNFEKGEVSAWIIIPANLSPGDSFYDAFDNRNYSIQGEQEETIAGATRAITYINTTGRYKQWDKATGVFVTTIDNVGNYTVSATAFATNMWNPQILGLDQNVIYAVVVAVVIVVIALVIVVFARKKK